MVFDGSDWTYGGDFPIPINSHCAVQVSDKDTMVFGGMSENTHLDTAYRFGANGKWEEMTPMSQIRRYAGCARLSDDLVMVVGGEDENNHVSNSVEYYTLSTDTYELVEDAIPVEVAAINLVEQAGRILLVGGYTHQDGADVNYNDRVYEYQEATRTWRELEGIRLEVGRTAEVVVATDTDILGTCNRSGLGGNSASSIRAMEQMFAIFAASFVVIVANKLH